MKIRYSVSDGPRGHCPRLFVLRVGHISRQNPPDILNIVVTRDGQPFIVRYALHPPPPPARSPRRVRAGRRGQHTHCGRVFQLIDRRFAISRPLQESVVGRRHANEENATVIPNLHRGGAECRGGGGDTSSVPEASHPPREDAPLADTLDSARRRVQRALCSPI